MADQKPPAPGPPAGPPSGPPAGPPSSADRTEPTPADHQCATSDQAYADFIAVIEELEAAVE
jgi:hypothetical protein